MTIQDYSFLFPWQLYQCCVIFVMCVPQGYKATECLVSMTKMPTRMGQTLCYTYIAYLIWLGSTVALQLFQLCKFEQRCIGISNPLAPELNALSDLEKPVI